MTATVAALLLATSMVPAEETDYRLAGPFQFRNLAVYLVRGNDTISPDIRVRTLDEAMSGGFAVVRETGTVNSLTIENRHREEFVFVLPGDIVKGGKQDRTLPNGFLLTPRSGKIPVESFCVEQGRWSKRGGESIAAFSVSEKTIVGKNLKLASKISRSQSDVWKNVERAQDKLGRNVGTDVKSKRSASSLQLTLENKELARNISAYTGAIDRATRADLPDAIGMAFAINGEFNSADLFGSRDLFSRLWPKLLEAAATEAVGEYEKDREIPSPPDPAELRRLLVSTESPPPQTERVAGGNLLHRHESPGKLTFDTIGPVGREKIRIHRNILAVTKQELSTLGSPGPPPRELPQTGSGNPAGQEITVPRKRGFLQRIFGGRR